MFVVPALIAWVFASPVAAVPQVRESCSEVSIVVFRHHPGFVDETPEVQAARARDAKAIFEAAAKQCGRNTVEGGLGSGYELWIHARDLGRWKAAIDGLMKAGTLTYYNRWHLDRRGYGLVPVR